MKKYDINPDKNGYFGKYGGQIIPPDLKPIFDEIESFYLNIKDDKDFQEELRDLLKNYVGRPSPIYYAKNLSTKIGEAEIYFKREDLNHTGAHKINHTLGEALIAKRMGKKKLLAEIKRQEMELLEARSQPLRRYLMKNVIPSLTEGLIETCKVMPEDPIDYLAEYLFKVSPAIDSKAQGSKK